MNESLILYYIYFFTIATIWHPYKKIAPGPQRPSAIDIANLKKENP